MPSVMRATMEVNGITSVKDLATTIVDLLTQNGFNLVYPDINLDVYEGIGTAILEPTVSVDPLYTEYHEGLETTSWRLAITAEGETLTVNLATPLQLKNDGTIASAMWSSEPENPGEIVNWIDRSMLDSIEGAIYPMSLLISVSDHGLFIGVWDQSTDEYQNENLNISPAFRWLLVQRPVDHKTGDVYTAGKAPVFCVFSVFEEGQIQVLGSEQPPPGTPPVVNGLIYKTARAQFAKKFVVRESDIYRPSLTRPADVSVEDSGAILNSAHQVSISEDNRYVVTVVKGLNTTRYAYTQELDMLAFTSADVIGQQSVIELDVYNEDGYYYRAMPANRVRNTGMRILCRVEPQTTQET